MLKDLYVMKVDAKQELDNIISENDIKRFLDLILVPEGIDINQVFDGDRYYFTGDKGAGKTTLLIYTALRAEQLYDAERSFIIFKEISKEEREDYKNMAHLTEYDKVEFGKDYDFEAVWKWVIYDNIVQTIKESPKTIFEKDESLELFIDAVEAIKTNPGKTKRRIPKITDGYVELSITTPAKIASLSTKINFQFCSKDDNKVRLSTLVNELDRLFMNLHDGGNQLYVIVDEMNLSFANSAEYERDIMMIRDLVITIENLNLLSKQSHGNVRIIGSIRNEVINSIASKGKEINKAIESYGIPIDWTIYSDDKKEHPLIKLLINYLRVSENIGKIKKGQIDDSPNNVIYSRWVSSEIYKKPSESIILENTLYRPRHIVRLLNKAKTICGNYPMINQNVMDAIRKSYSKECWDEVIEELLVHYSKENLKDIMILLTGIQVPITYEELLIKAEYEFKKRRPKCELLETFDEILRSLYRVGIIGNIIEGQRGKTINRWSFRGDETLMLNRNISVHRAFWPVLSITFRREGYSSKPLTYRISP